MRCLTAGPAFADCAAWMEFSLQPEMQRSSRKWQVAGDSAVPMRGAKATMPGINEVVIFLVVTRGEKDQGKRKN